MLEIGQRIQHSLCSNLESVIKNLIFKWKILNNVYCYYLTELWNVKLFTSSTVKVMWQNIYKRQRRLLFKIPCVCACYNIIASYSVKHYYTIQIIILACPVEHREKTCKAGLWRMEVWGVKKNGKGLMIDWWAAAGGRVPPPEKHLLKYSRAQNVEITFTTS